MTMRSVQPASLRPPSRRGLAVWRLIIVAGLVAAACGSDDTSVAGTDGSPVPVSPTDAAADDGPPDDGPPDDAADDGAADEPDPISPPGERTDGEDEPSPAPVVGDGSAYQATRAMFEITNREIHPIDEVVVAPDGLTLGVRYRAAAEPCSGAVATVVEDATSVTVTLETGLNPRAVAMTCIAEVIAYELAVGLAEPLDDREIITVG